MSDETEITVADIQAAYAIMTKQDRELTKHAFLKRLRECLNALSSVPPLRRLPDGRLEFTDPETGRVWTTTWDIGEVPS